MKSIFKMFRKKNNDSDFIRQLRKDLVLEIIRKRSAETSVDTRFTYKLTIAQEAEILLLYIIGKISIDSDKLIEWYNNK